MKLIRFYIILIIVLLMIVAVNALIAGYSFISDPSGAGLGITPQLLKSSPFESFLIPGLVLFVINGVFNLVAVVAVLLKWKFRFLFTAFQALMLAGWIFVQIIMLQEFNFLHYAMLIISFVLSIVSVALLKSGIR